MVCLKAAIVLITVGHLALLVQLYSYVELVTTFIKGE